ncbi:hypothetical protein D3Y57_03825 (plasmid) [Sphingomonas paeninsulae]|uniref:Uncharacterized protein n=1 Tax=Sphingomonas paeninsulae TaxID=2319844 RepID=A0A494T758_SPHPE|nr:hypothetical protein [Sphingomonas paeninsulae]AYJ85167.1 hypothetical protein D3Y57_03825 [Sphingomonas paeninsulae]
MYVSQQLQSAATERDISVALTSPTTGVMIEDGASTLHRIMAFIAAITVACKLSYATVDLDDDR